MRRIIWALPIGAMLPFLFVFCGILLSFVQPFLVLQAVGDLLIEAMIWPVQLFKRAFADGRPLSLETLIATYVFDALIIAGTACVFLSEGLARRIRLVVVAAAGLLLLCAPWGFSYKPSSAKLAEAFPKDAQGVFEDSQELTLYSIETIVRSSDDEPSAVDMQNIEQFHGYRVLGKVVIRDPIVRAQIKKFLYRSIDEGFAPAACFNPRHGIRAVQNNRVVEMIICFECGQMGVYADGQEGHAIVRGSIVENYYNRVLRTAGIPQIITE